MSNKFRSLTILIGVVALILASGCAAPKPAGLTDEQVAATAENALKALDANDYEKFVQDFSDPMKAAVDAAEFDSLRTWLHTASGQFVSLGKPTLTNNTGYVSYRFPAKYENETVYFTATFLIGGTKIEGTWFDSTNLRKTQK